jgi:hypothetical protein
VPSPSRRSWTNSNPSWKADMPFGFRKTFRLSKLLSLNMSKRGGSLAGRARSGINQLAYAETPAPTAVRCILAAEVSTLL